MEHKQTYYITTPIYYPSNKLHIGNAYCSVAADTMARFQKLMGKDVYFLTGTDEHGQKIERRAQEAGVTPIQFVDEIVAGIQELWKLMDIGYDDFLRTTQPRHQRVVQKIFKQLYDQGDIYKSEYEGLYCMPCESFWTPTQLKEGKCPDCGRDVELVREEAYFFKMSKYQDWLIEYIESHPEFIQPPSRANEMMNNFLRPGLQDLCVSRTSFTWGVPVDFDPGHVVYVWIDALSNYISALGYESCDDSLYQKYWPADMHLVGKEIVRFHTIYWPIMLKALGLPLPRQIFGHGWLVLDGGVKMSKSMGNVIDPVLLCQRYSSDAVRFFLLREVPFGSDGVFTNEALITRINSDLANDLGNLVSRTTAMIEKYFDGQIPAPQDHTELEENLKARALALPGQVKAAMEGMQFSQALAEIFKLVGECNKYIDLTQPWILGRSEEGRPRLATVLYTLAECARFVGVLAGPYMPRTPERLFAQLGITDEGLKTWESLAAFGSIKGGKVVKGEALFPRIDVKKELELLSGLLPAAAKKAEETPKETPKEEPAPKAEKPKAEKKQETVPEGMISIDQFFETQLKVALVTQAERVPKADKLLKLTLSLGENEERTVVSGIAQYYTPEEMVGKSVVLVANLMPAKLRGIRSEGMILCASDEEGNLTLVSPLGGMKPGSEVR